MASLVPFLVLLIVGFYWGRVIKLVVKTRKQTGNSAHFFPPELVGRIIRFIWYPTVGVWALTPLLVLVWSDPPAALRPLHENLPVSFVATAVAFVCLYLTMICWRRMGRDWRMGIDPNEKNNLIVSGPFKRVRHPIYALQQALAIATAVAVPVPMMLGVAVLEVVLLTWEALREERHLTRVHGETYRSYMKSTGRFIPSIAAREAA